MSFSDKELSLEADRLFQKLQNVGWSLADCDLIAPLTLEINLLKKQQNALILAHSYMTPDIMYGVADVVGDSYGLSVMASKHSAQKIIFCSVHFMGETAKLLSPNKEVLVPTKAGCSLADAIIANDVRELRKQHPDAGVVCYVNTSAAVKAESDVCCTSSNAVQIVEAMPQREVIFIPDEFMAKNLENMTSKTVIPWKGRCVVHEEFTEDTVQEIRKEYPGVQILAHPECSPSVVAHVDFAGGTSAMLNFMKESDADTFMLVTECGLTDRAKSEIPDKKIVGTCSLCPYMKKIMLKDVLKALKDPSDDQRVEISDEVVEGARRSLDRMFDLEKS